MGSKVSQHMDIITINEHNFERIETISSTKAELPSGVKPEQQLAAVLMISWDASQVMYIWKQTDASNRPFFQVGSRTPLSKKSKLS